MFNEECIETSFANNQGLYQLPFGAEICPLKGVKRFQSMAMLYLIRMPHHIKYINTNTPLY